jgi:hypothetical protein
VITAVDILVAIVTEGIKVEMDSTSAEALAVEEDQ